MAIIMRRKRRSRRGGGGGKNFIKVIINLKNKLIYRFTVFLNLGNWEKLFLTRCSKGTDIWVYIWRVIVISHNDLSIYHL